MCKQFWVIGGEYCDTSFAQLANGGPEAIGPFASYDAALAKWREVAVATRPMACVRYTIAADVAAAAN